MQCGKTIRISALFGPQQTVHQHIHGMRHPPIVKYSVALPVRARRFDVIHSNGLIPEEMVQRFLRLVCPFLP
ncbi:hypothetical protein D3C81_2013810 [compost metagenome]